MGYFGKVLIVIGIFFLIIGALFIMGEKFSFFGFGHLPGDIHIERRNFSLYFPITTSIILSIVLTLILNLIFRRR